MEHRIAAMLDRKTRRLNQTYLGFSINPCSGRYWTEEQFSEKKQRIVKIRIRVYSLDEAMSSKESLEDFYTPRGRRIGYLIKE